MKHISVFRNCSVVTILIGLAMASNAYAQTPTITLGDAVLRLGMTVNELQMELGKHPPMVLDEKSGSISNGYQSTKKDFQEHYRLYGEVEFQQGRLSHVEKHWRLTDSPGTAVSLGSTIYGAVSAMTGNLTQACTAHTWSASAPDQDYKETEIECDAPTVSRSVHIFIKTFHSSGGDVPDTQVSEVMEVP
jgi:hypothetical protein